MSNTTTSTDIYNGMTFIGHVVERDKGRRCEAFTAGGAAIGVFTSRAKAARSVYEAADKQQRGVAA
jgi:hypothetical protein